MGPVLEGRRRRSQEGLQGLQGWKHQQELVLEENRESVLNVLRSRGFYTEPGQNGLCPHTFQVYPEERKGGQQLPSPSSKSLEPGPRGPVRLPATI